MTYKCRNGRIGLTRRPVQRGPGPFRRVGRRVGRVLGGALKVYLLLVLAAIAGGGCASPNHFDKSPCACHFDDINTTIEG